ncbi:MAG: 16S rRNA (guanine(527)-N(7))-methyltransferase RsmG [Bacteroidetes bacterium]|nr:16S rRNA (guanine(527)-N(7))-methyltransferase RsmG [Bacteroidota bacterium]
MFHVKHFPLPIRPWQREKLRAYANLLQSYNKRLNLLSRRTTAEGFIEHIQECLAFVEQPFAAGSSLADWGTGAGLPAIPMAVMLPDVKVYAVDAAQKKIHAVKAFKRELDLPNLYPWHGRAEEFPFEIQCSVSRATAPLRTLWQWHTRVATSEGVLYCLKGGDLRAEQRELVTGFPAIQIKQIPVSGSSRFLVQVRSAPLPSGKESHKPLPPTEHPAQ